jgi:short-subunit dehydrogenase
MASVAVAEAAYAAMQKGKALVVPGMRNRLLAVLSRLVPIGATARMARRLLEDVPAAERR